MGIKYYDPTSGDVSRLANKATNSKYVITIDTALAHICASIGKKCIRCTSTFLRRKMDTIYGQLLHVQSKTVNLSYKKRMVHSEKDIEDSQRRDTFEELALNRHLSSHK